MRCGAELRPMWSSVGVFICKTPVNFQVELPPVKPSLHILSPYLERSRVWFWFFVNQANIVHGQGVVRESDSRIKLGPRNSMSFADLILRHRSWVSEINTLILRVGSYNYPSIYPFRWSLASVRNRHRSPNVAVNRHREVPRSNPQPRTLIDPHFIKLSTHHLHLPFESVPLECADSGQHCGKQNEAEISKRGLPNPPQDTPNHRYLLLASCLGSAFAGLCCIEYLGYFFIFVERRLLYAIGCLFMGTMFLVLAALLAHLVNRAFNSVIVSQKDLTTDSFCNTVSGMANVLSADKQTAIIAALAEGSSIRSIERITGVHRDTIMRLGVRVGKGCEMLLDSKMQDLSCNYLQLDEVWGFIGKKERHCRVDDNPEYGDVWTFCAIDSETKLVPSFKCGKRNAETANAFVQDIANRVHNRVQISTDALGAYGEAVERAFGADVDYGQIVKVYTHDAAQHPERKYSAPSFASAYRRSIAGNPEMELVSTSHVERLNATTRLHVKRLSRLTLAFSKKFGNFQAAVALHFAYYNFVRRHNTLRCTPAMAAGIERDFWSVGDLVEAVA